MMRARQETICQSWHIFLAAAPLFSQAFSDALPVHQHPAYFPATDHYVCQEDWITRRGSAMMGKEQRTRRCIIRLIGDGARKPFMRPQRRVSQ
jgi:hypothetical protein